MKRFLSQRQNKWLLLAALNKGERNMISYEVGKRYDAAIRGEGTQFDLADDGAFLAVYFSCFVFTVVCGASTGTGR